MTSRTTGLSGVAAARAAARLWSERSTVPREAAPCTFALVQDSAPLTAGRFCYVSLSSQLEDLGAVHALRLGVDGPGAMSQEEVYDRLCRGEVGVLATSATGREAGPPPPQEVVRRRDQLRLQQSYVKYLVLQIALDEMTAVRGASGELLDELVSVWSVPLAITLDLAVLFTLGADRQRYVSDSYATTVDLRRRAVLDYLARRGVASNPLLAL